MQEHDGVYRARAVKMARWARDWTQNELARRMQIDPKTLRDVEKRRAEIDNTFTLRLCQVTGINVFEFGELVAIARRAEERERIQNAYS